MSCEVTLSTEDRLARLTVTDDGHGSTDGPGTGGRGIRGLAERANAVGGTLEASGSPHGYVVRVEAPLSQNGEAV